MQFLLGKNRLRQKPHELMHQTNISYIRKQWAGDTFKLTREKKNVISVFYELHHSWLDSGLSSQSSRFIPSVVNVGRLMDEMALRKVLLQEIHLPPMLHTHVYNCLLKCVMGRTCQNIITPQPQLGFTFNSDLANSEEGSSVDWIGQSDKTCT
jgi:hypothetical protein